MIISIQYLRGLAAVMVLLHHTAFKLDKFSINPLDWMTAGDIGVDIFFIISGFVMCHSMGHKHETTGVVRSFLLGRAKRILPLYWLLTAVGLLVYLIKPGVVNSSGGQTDILSSFLLIPSAGKYIINNGWTLSYEFYFYLIFCIGLTFSKNTGRLIVASILLMLSAIGHLIGPSNYWLDVILSTFLVEFASGILIYMLFEKSILLTRLPSLMIGVVGIIYWMGINLGHSTGHRLIDYGVPALLISYALISWQPTGKHTLSAFFEHLGDISYSLYLFHPFALSLVTLLLIRFAPNGAAEILYGPLMLAISIASSGLLYKYAEKPIQNILKAKRR
jgi:peptidoglycan/LPS O-acetylase OafA/YrhL